MTLDIWEHAARQFEAPRQRWATPGDLAKHLNPATVQTPALDLIDEALVRVANTPDSRLIISMPPQEGKSTRAAGDFPAWLLTENSDLRIVAASYGQSLANRNGRSIRRRITSHPELGLRIAPDNGAVHEWEIEGHTGGVFSVGVGGGVTGRAADLLIIDDPIKDRAQADSQTYRDHVWDWWTDAAAARLAPGAPVMLILCMTGDTPVLRPDGTETPLRDIRPGDQVATYEDGKLATSTVMNWANQGPDEVFRVRMKSGRVVRANARHPFLTISEDGTETWVRTDQLRPGAFIRRVTGGSGAESPARPTDANCQRAAKACATRTTTKLAGQKGIEHLRSPLPTAVEPSSSTATGSLTTRSINSSTASTGFVRSASGHRATRTPEPTGAGNFASTTTTRPARSEDSSATTAISLSDTARHPRYSDGPLTTWTVTADEIVAVEPCGVEDVFDLQIERTENFIANGLVSHNTRWHHDDLAGRLLDRDADAGWEVLNIPAQAVDADTDPLGRQPGEFMVSARGRTEKQWEQRKRTAGSRTWASLYQGNPTPDTGNLFPADGWARYELPQWIVRDDGTRIVPDANSSPDVELVQSWDFAFKDTESSDYVVGQVWLRRGIDAYLLDQVRRRAGFSESCQMMLDLTARWPQAVAKLVEDKANGPAILNALRAKVGGLIPVEPEGSKYARAAAITPLVESRNVLLPDSNLDGCAWVADLTDEARDFPSSAHDDTVDAMSQAVHRLLLVPLLAGDMHDADDILDQLHDDPLDWEPSY